MKNVYIDQVVIYIDHIPKSGYMRSDSEYIRSVDEICMFDVYPVISVDGGFAELEYKDQIFTVWPVDLARFEDFPEDVSKRQVRKTMSRW